MSTWTRALLVVALSSGVLGCHQDPPTAEPPTQKPATCSASFLDAIRSGAADAIETHLALGCKVNDVLKLDMTPLQWAAELGKSEVAKTLIDKGADVNAQRPAAPPWIDDVEKG